MMDIRLMAKEHCWCVRKPQRRGGPKALSRNAQPPSTCKATCVWLCMTEWLQTRTFKGCMTERLQTRTSKRCMTERLQTRTSKGCMTERLQTRTTTGCVTEQLPIFL